MTGPGRETVSSKYWQWMLFVPRYRELNQAFGILFYFQIRTAKHILFNFPTHVEWPKNLFFMVSLAK